MSERSTGDRIWQRGSSPPPMPLLPHSSLPHLETFPFDLPTPLCPCSLSPVAGAPIAVSVVCCKPPISTAYTLGNTNMVYWKFITFTAVTVSVEGQYWIGLLKCWLPVAWINLLSNLINYNRMLLLMFADYFFLTESETTDSIPSDEENAQVSPTFHMFSSLFCFAKYA